MDLERITLTREAIAHLRLRTLGLGGAPVAEDPAGVVEHHLAMQGQDFRAARWAIGSRLPGITEAEVLAAFDSGAIVRSWPMRGTVHVVAAPDLPWMLEHLGPRALVGVKRRWEHLGIDEAMLERAREVAVRLLGGGGRATRSELVEALTGAGLDLSGQRAYHTVWYLSQTGTLVQGPTREGDHELVLLDEWIPSPRRFDRKEALRELARRYLAARGPATVEDLVHWTRLTKGDARRAFAAIRDECVEVDAPGGPYRMLRRHLDESHSVSPEAGSTVVALAAFDEHLLGYRNRDCVLDPDHATLVDPARNGVFRWTLVAGGRVIATWKRIRRTHHVIAEVSPFGRVPALVRRGAEEAIEEWARFAGAKVEVRWASPG